jgi:hypothetical protein
MPGATGHAEAAVPDTALDQSPGDHLLRRTSVINVGPRPVPLPQTRDELAAPTTAPKGHRGLGLNVILFFVLVAVIVLVVTIVAMSGVRAASAADDPVRVGTRVLSVTG